SSYVDRSVFTDDSESDVESLIKNLKNVIIKKLSVLCVTESSAFSSAFSISFSAALSQSSTSTPVSDSLTPATSAPATPGFTVSAFIISSSHFKKMLHRLNKSCLSRIISLLNSVKIMKDICVFENENMNIILFYTHRCEAFASVSEIILIEDDNTAETILFCFQASLITFSLFSAEKIIYTL
ncbi:hypothetical protein BDDG_12280, partial [Blastomyces dermatitidis ATCC 18188]